MTFLEGMPSLFMYMSAGCGAFLFYRLWGKIRKRKYFFVTFLGDFIFCAAVSLVLFFISLTRGGIRGWWIFAFIIGACAAWAACKKLQKLFDNRNKK